MQEVFLVKLTHKFKTFFAKSVYFMFLTWAGRLECCRSNERLRSHNVLGTNHKLPSILLVCWPSGLWRCTQDHVYILYIALTWGIFVFSIYGTCTSGLCIYKFNAITLQEYLLALLMHRMHILRKMREINFSWKSGLWIYQGSFWKMGHPNAESKIHLT